MSYRLLPPAYADLEAIDDWVFANFGEAAAIKARREILHVFDLLAKHQEMGHSKPEAIRRPVKFFRAGPNWIIYQAGDPLQILRIFPAAMDLKRLEL